MSGFMDQRSWMIIQTWNLMMKNLILIRKTAEMDKVLIISRKPRGSLDAIQERSQDLNWSLQDIVQNFDDNMIIMTLTSSLWHWHHYRDTGKNMKNFKYCVISLNVVHTGGLWGVLGFTAPLILISKKLQGKYIYTLNSALCARIARAAIKQLLLGLW